MACATFTPFPRLPAELRVMIWRESLPQKDEPALFFYKKGCWLATDDNDDSLSLVFHHYLLNHVPVRVPLAFVNFEARSIALTWVRQQGIQIVFCKERKCHVFERPFDPTRDVICVSLATWRDFCEEGDECIDELFEDDLRTDSTSDIQHIAFPASRLIQLFDWHMNIKSISIVVGTPPSLKKDMEKENRGMSMPRRWELPGGREKAFIWHDKCGSFFIGILTLGLGGNICTTL